MTSPAGARPTDPHLPPSRRRWPLRRIGLAVTAMLAACLAVLVLLPTPLVESAAGSDGSSIVRCGRISGLSVHLASWPVVGRVLFGASLGVRGHADTVTTSSYAVHDVRFSARSVKVNRSALLGGDVRATVTGLTATATLTLADLTRTVRGLSHLPIDITAFRAGAFEAQVRLGLLDVAVPVSIGLSGGKVRLSTTPLPVIGPFTLLVSPPAGITLRKLVADSQGLHVDAGVQPVNTRTVLCNPLTGTRS